MLAKKPTNERVRPPDNSLLICADINVKKNLTVYPSLRTSVPLTKNPEKRGEAGLEMNTAVFLAHYPVPFPEGH